MFMSVPNAASQHVAHQCLSGLSGVTRNGPEVVLARPGRVAKIAVAPQPQQCALMAGRLPLQSAERPHYVRS
jgi:hypothetical protein